MRPRVLVGAALLISAPAIALAQISPAPSSSHALIRPTPTPVDTDPIPDVKTLIAQVRARYTALETLRKSYIFTVIQVADEFSASGRKSTHTDEYQAFFVGETELLQHIARDGKPLSPEDAKKEQERIDKQIAQLKAHPLKTDKDSIRLSASGLLKVATFSNPRREQIDGRPTIVFDYKGDPGAKAVGLSQQIMRDLAGTLWIDQRDSAIVRLNGSLQENFHVAGGLLVNIRRGSWFDFTQMPVNGEIWFPKTFVVHVDGRFLLVKGFNGDAHDSFSGYHKLKTTVTILPGSRVIPDAGLPPPQPQTSSPPATTPPIETGESQQ